MWLNDRALCFTQVQQHDKSSCHQRCPGPGDLPTVEEFWPLFGFGVRLYSGAIQHLKVTAKVKENEISVPSKEGVQVNIPSLFERWY